MIPFIYFPKTENLYLCEYSFRLLSNTIEGIPFLSYDN